MIVPGYGQYHLLVAGGTDNDPSRALPHRPKSSWTCKLAIH